MTTTNKETHDLHVQSNISIITDGSRGVTLSQVISTADSNGAPAGIPMNLQDKRYAVPANYQRVNLPDVKMIKPRESKSKDRNNHSHHHHHHRPQLAITDSQAAKSHRPETKVKHAKSSSKDGSDKDKRHGKPSAVKSRSSKKSSVKSSKSSSSSKYSEPNPILPDAQAQDLAELLLEKLSGTSISSKSASTLRLSSIHESLNDDTFKSQTDKSFFSEVSKDGTRKFTANDGRPLDKNEKPEVRVRFENSQQGRIGPVTEKTRPLTSAHAPLSTQLFVSKTYPSNFEKEPKQNEFFTKSVQTEPNVNVQFASNDGAKPKTPTPTRRERPSMNGGQNVTSNQYSSFISQPSCRTQISQPSCKYYANLTPTLSYDNKQTVTVHMTDKQAQNSAFGPKTVRRSIGPFPQRNYYGYVPPANGPFLATDYFSENTTV